MQVSRFRVLAAGLVLELAGGSIYIVSLYLHDLQALWFPNDVNALEKAESLARRIPGARLRTWDGAGHFFWAHRTAEVCGELSLFLESSDE